MQDEVLQSMENNIIERFTDKLKQLIFDDNRIPEYRECEVRTIEELPLTCDCGCEETIHKNSYYEEIGEVEYDLHCAQCDRYLGHFVYGCWEY